MKTTHIILLSIILAILLTMLILWCAEVLAHGNPAAHFEPYTEADPCWDSSCKDPEYIGGHGHIDDYDDENGNDRWDLGEENSWGYWTCGGYKSVVPETDCSEPQSPPDTTSPVTESFQTSPTTTPLPIAAVLDDLIEDEMKDEPDKTREPEPIPESKPEPEPCEKVWISFDLTPGFNLFHLPIQFTDGRTVAGLHKALGITGDLAIYSYDGTDWHEYSGDTDRATPADAELGVYTGLVVSVDTSASVSMQGCPLSLSEPLTLQPGMNLIGFPEPPPGVTLVSDLLELDETICAIITEIDGEFFIVGRAGDPGDEPLRDGQAVILIATEPTSLDLISSVEATQDMSAHGWGMEKTRTDQ